MTFDLEAAKRGEPIEYFEAYGWVEIKFIGAWTDDSVVCQVPWNDKPEIVSVSKIRMAKREKEIRKYRVALMDEYTMTADNYSHETGIERGEYGVFKGWITDWQEYEIGAKHENTLPKSI